MKMRKNTSFFFHFLLRKQPKTITEDAKTTSEHDLDRHPTYFPWFSCAQQRHSNAQPSPEHVFCVVSVPLAAPQQRPIFPGARILRGFLAASTATPEHIFYVVFVPPAAPQQRPTFPGARVLRDFRTKNTHFHCKIHAFSLTLL